MPGWGAGTEEWKALYPADAGYSADERDYYGVLSALDAQVGRVRRLLQDHGVAEDTAVFFCSVRLIWMARRCLPSRVRTDTLHAGQRSGTFDAWLDTGCGLRRLSRLYAARAQA